MSTHRLLLGVQSIYLLLADTGQPLSAPKKSTVEGRWIRTLCFHNGMGGVVFVPDVTGCKVTKNSTPLCEVWNFYFII